MGELFGTDGVRGEANQELTPQLAFELGKAGAYYLTSQPEQAQVLIGKDTRLSGDMLESALAAGITSLGIDVIKVGVVPTPVVAYLTKKLDVEAGIMISASHNPVQDNGIKFFNQAGFKLTDEEELEIEDILANNLADLPLPGGDQVGCIKERPQAKEQYIKYIQTTVDSEFTDLKIVVDTANGAAYEITPQVLSELGAEVITLNDQPDGQNINVDCGSTHPEQLQEAVVEADADLGFAHDGDADRVIAVDDQGQLIDGDYILAICGLQMIEDGELPGNKVVATRYSNLGLHQALEAAGGEVKVVKNGDRYVLAELKKNDYLLGGEQSGHIIWFDYNTTGDGLLTALQLMDVMQKTGQSLSELRQRMSKLPQVLVNVEVADKDWEDKQAIQEAITEVEEILGTEGRIFVRASGTEPVIRIMLEGEDEEQLDKLAKQVAEVVEKQLTVDS